MRVVQDPAAGTGGFLVAADRAIKDRTDDLFALKTDAQRFQRDEAFRGLELVSDTHRLLLMNLMLHGIGGDLVRGGDAMGPDGEALGGADLILTNPPVRHQEGRRPPGAAGLHHHRRHQQQTARLRGTCGARAAPRRPCRHRGAR